MPIAETTPAVPTLPTAEWESPLAALLGELSETQGALLAHLGEKRRMLLADDRAGLASIEAEGAGLAARLDACQRKRQELLDQAAASGVSHSNLRSLAEDLPATSRAKLRPAIHTARAQARMLQHQSLANWVLVQRTLLHLSQMVEIIATRGEQPPTYQRSGKAAVAGSLVDRAV
ncbi:MAG: flagellar export chaperone FlgN [Lacipirellulaceae bacterium]